MIETNRGNEKILWLEALWGSIYDDLITIRVALRDCLYLKLYVKILEQREHKLLVIALYFDLLDKKDNFVELVRSKFSSILAIIESDWEKLIIKYQSLQIAWKGCQIPSIPKLPHVYTLHV